MTTLKRNGSTSTEFFEAKYRLLVDPWGFACKDYELSRYRTIIAALSHRRYKHAFEPGCSIGVLTAELSRLCDTVLATDFSQLAVARAQVRCALMDNVVIQCRALSLSTSCNSCDLLILSEIGYYFTEKEWHKTCKTLIDSMRPGGIILAAHWLGSSADHCMTGDQVHHTLLSLPRIRVEHSERHASFRLDRMARN